MVQQFHGLYDWHTDAHNLLPVKNGFSYSISMGLWIKSLPNVPTWITDYGCGFSDGYIHYCKNLLQQHLQHYKQSTVASSQYILPHWGRSILGHSLPLDCCKCCKAAQKVLTITFIIRHWIQYHRSVTRSEIRQRIYSTEPMRWKRKPFLTATKLWPSVVSICTVQWIVVPLEQYSTDKC